MDPHADHPDDVHDGYCYECQVWLPIEPPKISENLLEPLRPTRQEQLVKAAEAALHLLETPGDFTEEEAEWVVIDLDIVLHLAIAPTRP